MTLKPGEWTIEDEHRAFEEQLEKLLKDHAEEFVLWKNGEPLGFFSTCDEAYDAGLEKLGLDTDFLVSQVKVQSTQEISLSLCWRQ